MYILIWHLSVVCISMVDFCTYKYTVLREYLGQAVHVRIMWSFIISSLVQQSTCAPDTLSYLSIFFFFKRSICAVCTFPWPSSALSVLSIFLDYQIKRHSDLFSTVCVALYIRNSHERNTLSKRFWSELFPIAKDPSGLRTVGFYFFYKCNVVSIFLWTSLILNLGVEHSFGQG